MSEYTALARKWRPRSFAEMTGQEHVLKALTNSLASGRVHHAFLFAGTRGVGKTTVARIFAKCLNCEQGITATPCDACASCREIDAGRSVDLVEVDAASRTRVDDTRELLDNVQYAPTHSRHKIYLIDEVHMLSAHSFNALLKTLEEPPPHVKFLLATTDPQKLPVTVLSRCLQFNLKRLSVSMIVARMAHILQAEGIACDPAALQLIAIAGDGSLRDSLSLLDQLLAFGNGQAREADARIMLGTVERDHVVHLIERLAAGDANGLLEYARQMDEQSPDYAQCLQQLASLLEAVALKQAVPAYAGDELHDAALLARLAAALDPEDVQLYYQIAILGRRDLPLAPEPRAGFRMTLIRMVAFRPGAAGTNVGTPGARPPAAATRATSGAGAVTPPGGARESDWAAILAALDLQGAPRQLASNCTLIAREGATMRLALDGRGAALRTRGVEEKLAQALSRHFGETIRVEFEQRSGLETPSRASDRLDAERLQRARSAFESDPMVGALTERFGARVIPESVRPLPPNDKEEE